MRLIVTVLVCVLSCGALSAVLASDIKTIGGQTGEAVTGTGQAPDYGLMKELERQIEQALQEQAVSPEVVRELPEQPALEAQTPPVVEHNQEDKDGRRD